MVELYGRQGGEFVVNGNADQFQGNPAAARLASGELVIVWTSFVSTGVFEVRGQRYSADGTPIGGDFPVTSLNGNVSDARVEALSTGGFVVTWTYDVHDGSGADPAAGTALRIHGQIFDSAGAKLGGERAFSSGALVDDRDSQPIALADGGFAVSFTRATSTNNVANNDVVVQLFDSAGNATGQLTRISASSAGNQIGASLASLAGGGFVATWQDIDSSGPGIKAQLFDSAGAKLGGEFIVNTVTDSNQYQPTVAALASGGFVVTWTHLNPGAGNPSGNDIKGQVYTAAGARVGGEFLVNSVTANHQHNAYVTSLAGGGFVVGWRDLSTGDGDIAAQAFDSAGAKQGHQFTVNTETQGSQGSVALVGLAGGGFVAAWNGSDSSGTGVKAQFFSSDAAPTDIALSAATLNENAVENLAVATLSATGAVNSGFSYSIVSDSTGGAFRVDGDKLVVDDNAKLDFETAPQATVTIRVTDSDGQTYDEAFVLDVTDIVREKRLSADDSFLANVTQSGTQGESILIPLASGGFALLWGQIYVGTPGAIEPDSSKTMVRFFDSAGNPVSGEIAVATEWLYEPAVIPLASGGFLIAHVAHNEPSGMNSIKAQAYDSSGSAVGAPIFAGSVPSGTDFLGAAAAAQLDSGQYLLGWANGGGALFGQRFTSDGMPVGGQIDIAPASGGDLFSLTATPGGGFAAAWWDDLGTDPDGDGPFEVSVRFFDSSGVPSGPPIVIPAGSFAIEHIDIVPLAGGGYVLGWVETIGEMEGIPINVVKAQLIGPNGALSGEPLAVSLFGMNDDSGPDVNFSAHPDGGFLVTWPFPDLATADFETGQVDYSLNAQLFDSLGQPVGPVFQPTAIEAGGVSAVLADGTIVTSWTGPDSNDMGVHVRMFRPANSIDDVLTGDGDADLLDGADGNDKLYGLGGADDLRGGAGNDEVEGGEGEDTLDGGDGDDRLAGGEGKDSYSGGTGTDTLDFAGEPGPVVVNLSSNFFFFPAGHPFGSRSVGPGEALDSFGNYESHSGIENLVLTAGNDGALGSEGSNRIEAGAGNDLLNGMGGNDILDGGEGDDRLDGGTGDDSMTGGVGNDIFVVDSASDTVVENAGEGVDEVRTTLAVYSLFGTHVENLRAFSNVAHDFRGNGSNNVVTGSTGSDVIRLEDGGNDSAVGGGGNDQIYYGAAFTAADTNDGGSGTDVVILQGDYSITLAAGSLANVEYLSLQSATSTRYRDQPLDSHDYDITFVDANVGAGQRFTVNASQLLAHEDFRFNGAAESNGSFLIYGGYGADVLAGGSGNDIFHFEGSRWGAGDSVNGGAGADSVVIRAGSGNHQIQFGETQLIGVESVSVSNRFGLGQASLPSYEMVLANGNVTPGGTLIVNGSTLLDPGQFLKVDGSAVRDGHLKLYGGAGADTLIGGDGDDLIYAAGGADRMTGGAGRDVFQLRSLSDSPGSGPDLILDFVSGTDKIDLGFIDANSNADGNQAFTFVGAAFSGNGTAGSGVAGELRAYEDLISGAWIVEGDVNGDGNADFEIVVFMASPGPLVGSDFIA